jgi:hypothetical protein
VNRTCRKGFRTIEAYEIDARNGQTLLVYRTAILTNRPGDPNPTEVTPEAGRPDHGTHVGSGELKLENRRIGQPRYGELSFIGNGFGRPGIDPQASR